MSKFIITYTPCFKRSMLAELRKIDEQISIVKEINNGIMIINSNLEKNEFLKKLINVSPIFIKHSMPVMLEGKISENFDNDKQMIYNDCSSIVTLKENDPFAVQCRIIGGGTKGLPYSSKDIEVFVGSNYESKGCIPTFSDDNLKNEDIDIISILINGDNYYIGFSTNKENLNFHCDEYRICSRNGREISRAENKLKEALMKFAINLSGVGFALDIGAAPGGWTKVLADYGYNVIAVDPGDLKPELENNPKIKHYKCRIEDLKFNNFFDIIVNDMNVDPQTTAKIMNSLSESLKDGGLAIVTLKLPNKIDEDIRDSISILNSYYDVLTVKSLFHNRQEVTALIKKRTLLKEQSSNSVSIEREAISNDHSLTRSK